LRIRSEPALRPRESGSNLSFGAADDYCLQLRQRVGDSERALCDIIVVACIRVELAFGVIVGAFGSSCPRSLSGAPLCPAREAVLSAYGGRCAISQFPEPSPGAQSTRTVLRRSVLHGRNTATYGVAYNILISFALQNRAKRVNEALCIPVGHIRDSAILNGATVCENHECSGESSPRQIAGDRRGCSDGPSGIGRTV